MIKDYSNFSYSHYDTELVSLLSPNSPKTPVPENLRSKRIVICRKDLSNSDPFKLHIVYGFRIEQKPYPIDWWAELPEKLDESPDSYEDRASRFGDYY